MNLKTKIEKLNQFIKNNKVFKYTSFCVIALVAGVVTAFASGITFGYTVRYSDDVIAVVSGKADYTKANSIVFDNLKDDGTGLTTTQPKFGFTLTITDQLNNTQEIVDAIIDNNNDIVEGTVLKVNGETVACVEADNVQEYLDARLHAFDKEGAENSPSFADAVVAEQGYFLKSNLTSIDDLSQKINALDIQTVSVVKSTVEVPHETKNVKTPEKTYGYSAVTVKGENGIVEKTEQIISLNGVEQSTTKLSETVIKEQVTEVVTIGTGIGYVPATAKANVASAGFICPLQSGSYKISSYYGDGRNHKGVDLVAKAGTPIFSVAEGKVIYSGWDSDFGYNIIIQHNNGIKTRYAHAKALCVAKGATVQQGEMIATVGSTGWSTGNHLHFEVIVNGNRVNPAPYIGL